MTETILKYFNPQYIIIFGAIIGIYGSYLAYVKSEKDSEDSLKRDELNTALSVEIKKLTEANHEFSKQNLEYSKILENYSIQNEKIISKLDNTTNNINNQITGGESYCIVLISNIQNDIGHVMLRLGENNKFPLKNIQGRIVDLNNFPKYPTIENLSENSFNYQSLESDGVALSNIQIHLDKEKGVNLNIFYSANNGFYSQATRMRFINGKWSSAIIIYRDKDAKEMYCKIDKTYPVQDKKLIFK